MSLEPDAQEGHGDEAVHLEHDFTGPLTPPVARLIRVFFVLSALLFLADFFVDRKIHQPAEKIPGFYAIYGFIGCVVLVLVAKQMRKVVMRDEDYYERLADERDAALDASTKSNQPGGHR
ncbi:hypothetical protein Poly30_43740 [Planctomycetes bacterium Poly30]|uniref:Uncharacterized protein n=1 Tax=Saltatorellus ferox TaxID=2528018 RepID=A0A518EXK4_9BACT|nr:hypothetical protein Poly30_43740 [Planctomycetes bacterium Poly30]